MDGHLERTRNGQCCEKLGAGEILLNCVDKDGQKDGFDLALVKVRRVANSCLVPPQFCLFFVCLDFPRSKISFRFFT